MKNTITLISTLFVSAVAFATPLKSIRFPGSGAAEFETDGRLLVAGTGWTVESGAVIWDVTKPSEMRFVADLRGRGYTTAPPVFVGSRVYMPLWFGAMCIDISDTAAPKIESLLDFDFPRHTCDWIVRDGNGLYLCTPAGTREYDVSDAASPAVYRGFTTNVLAKPKPVDDPRRQLLPRVFRRNARFAGDYAYVYDGLRESYRVFRIGETNAVQVCERFITHSLSTVAVAGSNAYIYTPGRNNIHGLLTLDLSGSGCVDFKTNAIFHAPAPRGSAPFVMRMQSVGAVTALDSRRLLADDCPVEFDEAGNPSFAGERELPVCNYSFDYSEASSAKRIALAQSSQVKIADVGDPREIKVSALWKADELTHATGVALSGDDCWVLTQARPEPRQNFLTYVPRESTLRKLRAEGTSLVERASCAIPTSVSCVYAGKGIVYAAGINCYDNIAGITVVDGAKMEVIAHRKELSEGSVFRIKRFGDRIFFSDTLVGIKELDFSDPRSPRVCGVWRRGEGSNPSYNDFTVDGKYLYALSHSALDVYDLDKSESPESLKWTSPRFEMNFGAVEKGRLDLGGGLEAVAYGEGGLIMYKDGKYLSELPPAENGLCPVYADSVTWCTDSPLPALIVEDKLENRRLKIDITKPESPKIISEDKLP